MLYKVELTSTSVVEPWMCDQENESSEQHVDVFNTVLFIFLLRGSWFQLLLIATALRLSIDQSLL